MPSQFASALHISMQLHGKHCSDTKTAAAGRSALSWRRSAAARRSILGGRQAQRVGLKGDVISVLLLRRNTPRPNMVRTRPSFVLHWRYCRPMPGKSRNRIGGLRNGNGSGVGRPRAATEKLGERVRPSSSNPAKGRLSHAGTSAQQGGSAARLASVRASAGLAASVAVAHTPRISSVAGRCCWPAVLCSSKPKGRRTRTASSSCQASRCSTTARPTSSLSRRR